MSTGAEGQGRYSDETVESLGLLDTTKYYDVTAHFLVAAENENDAREKVYNFVTTTDTSSVEDWDVDTIEPNTQWEV